MESYKTFAAKTTASITEKKSEFIAVASPAKTEDEALQILTEIKAKHRTAAHNVYAYCLLQNARQRYSDDGEPAKTAGLPVLSVISHAEVTNCIIVVTRYFGGTLLGTGGLVRAYTSAAKKVLNEAEILTVRLCGNLLITIEYSMYEPVLRLLKQAGAKIKEPNFAADVSVCATLPFETIDDVCEKLTQLLRGNLKAEISKPFFAPF